MATGFATIGHSDRDPDTIIDMLRADAVTRLVDVRAFPRSRTNPGFNIEVFPDRLAAAGIGYVHMRALGGRRARQAGVDPALNGWWRVQSFHNYADYALGPDFAAALDEVIATGAVQRLALMCSEAVWWRCHRRIITDHLLLRGHAVTHLLGPGHAEAATPTPAARRDGQGRITYPAEAGQGRTRLAAPRRRA